MPFKRYNLFSAGHYDITDHLTVYGRGMYKNNTIDTIIAPSGVFASAVNVPINNRVPDRGAAQFLCANGDFNPALPGRQTITAAAVHRGGHRRSARLTPHIRQVTFGLRRRTPEVGPRISDYNTQMFDFRAGVRGDITDKIGFDVWGARGISDKKQAIQNYVLLSRTQQALLASSTTTCFDDRQ